MALAASSLYMYSGGIVFDLSINAINGTDYVYDHGVRTEFRTFEAYVAYTLKNKKSIKETGEPRR